MSAVDHVVESERQTPVIARADVIVVGSGPAGIIAAIAAARTGADTLLIERYDYVGGYFANQPGGQSVGVSFQDMNGDMIIRGIPWEFMERLISDGGAVGPQDLHEPDDEKVAGNVSTQHGHQSRHIGKTKPMVEYEAVKSLAFRMFEEEGVRVLLHSMVAGAVVENEAVRGVFVETKSGRGAIHADVVVDCTGDADVAYFAGAPTVTPPKQEYYQISRSFAVAVRDELGRPVIVGGVNSDYDYGDGTDPWDLTRAELELRRKAEVKLAEMKKREGYEKAYIYGPGESQQLGVRETRQLVGMYTLTEEDIVEGAKFDDAIASSANPIDMHKSGGSNENRSVKTDYHDIPYRSLVPRSMNGLLVAGRCISCSHVAEAAIRKVPVCMATGHAAGTAAALCVLGEVEPRSLDYDVLTVALSGQGATRNK
jgi:hypothetical protein